MDIQEQLYRENQCLERYLSYVEEVKDSLEQRNEKVVHCISSFEKNQKIFNENQRILQQLKNLTKQISVIDDEPYIKLLNEQLSDAIKRKEKIKENLYANVNELEGYDEYRFRTDDDVFEGRMPLPSKITPDSYKELKDELEQSRQNTIQKKEILENMTATNTDFCNNNEQAANIDIVYDKSENIENQIHSLEIAQSTAKEHEDQEPEPEPETEKGRLDREKVVNIILHRIAERRKQETLNIQQRTSINTLDTFFRAMIDKDIDEDRFSMIAGNLKLICDGTQRKSYSASTTPTMQTSETLSTPKKLTLKEIEERKQKLLDTAKKYGVTPKTNPLPKRY